MREKVVITIEVEASNQLWTAMEHDAGYASLEEWLGSVCQDAVDLAELDYGLEEDEEVGDDSDDRA